MPIIYEYFGLVFYFYSNEHDPIHVHVRHGDKETIFELIIFNNVLTEIKQRKKRGKEFLSDTDTKKAIDFILFYADDIVKKWMQVFVLKKEVYKKNIVKKIDKQELHIKELKL